MAINNCIPESKTGGEIQGTKKSVLLEKVEEAVLSGHKILIFTNFLAAVEEISWELTHRGLEHLVMTGETKDRGSLVHRFQNDEKIRVFVLTLKTGGFGLNLTAADMVFIYDPWWNVAAENQAIDRIHRLGQGRKVFCYRLIARGTIEEKILALQERKKALFESIITSDLGAIKQLSPEDLNYLLS